MTMPPSPELKNEANLIDIPDYHPRTNDLSQFSYLRHHFQEDSLCAVVTIDVTLNSNEPVSEFEEETSKPTLKHQTSQLSLIDDHFFNSPSIFAEINAKFKLLVSYTAHHPSLCTYIDCIQGQLEYATRIFLVQESFSKSLASLIASDPAFKTGCHDLSRIQKWTTQLVSALSHLQLFDIQHRNLIPENIFIDSNDNLKLFNYGVYYLTASYQPNKWTSFNACPPEVLFFGTQNFSSFKADVWAIGLLLFKLFTGTPLLPETSPETYFAALLELYTSPDIIMRKLNENIPENFSSLKSLLQSCLTIDPEKRPSSFSLLSHSFLIRNSLPLHLGSTDQSKNLHVLFHLWLLDSGSLNTEFTKATGISPLPPILTFPFIYSPTIPVANSTSGFVPLYVYSLFLLNFNRVLASLTLSDPIHTYFATMANQPLQVRLKSVPYQFHRIQYCSDLLLQYPLSKTALRETCACDLPPFLRGELWAALLNIPPHVAGLFSKHAVSSLAKEYGPDEHRAVLERQLEADLPRCHVYDLLISSSLGQGSIKKLIHAWLEACPNHVYWQGFDSVCAVFVSLNFTRLDLAYGSLLSFVEKYLTNLLVPNNHDALHAHIAQFHFVLTFMDPILEKQLVHLHLDLQHFGISWFLTLFAHDFEISQIYLVWDHLFTQPFSSPFLIMANLLRLPPIRSSLVAATSLEDGLYAVSEFPPFDVIELLQSVHQDLKWIPKSTLASFQLKEEPKLPQISYADCLENAAYLRIIDLRPLSSAVRAHLPGSTFIALRNLSGLESIMNEQRTDKKITVLRGDPRALVAAWKILSSWCVPGLCCLGDLETPTCPCLPTEISLASFSLHKCKQPTY